MNVPIKMIGIATALFWLLLIGFSISAAMSLRDLQFSLGNPRIISTPDGKLQLMLPISIGNTGRFSINAFNMTSRIRNSGGMEVASGSTYVETISPGQTVTTTHTSIIDSHELLSDNQSLIFNDSDIELDKYISMALLKLIPVTVETNSTIPWGAPLNNFTIEIQQFSPYNATHFIGVVPFSFQNHATFDSIGAIQLRIYDTAGNLVAQNQTGFQVPQLMHYSGYFTLIVPAYAVNTLGSFEAYILTPTFDCGPVMVPYG